MKKRNTIIPGTLSVLLDKRCCALVSYEQSHLLNTALRLSELLIKTLAETVAIIDINILQPNTFKQPHPNNVVQDVFSPNPRTINEIKIPFSSQIDLFPCRRESNDEIAKFYSKHLSRLLDHFKQNYHYSLYILPPLTLFSGLSAITPHFDSVIINLISGRTKWENAKFLKDGIETCGGKICGTILSERTFFVPEFIYKSL